MVFASLTASLTCRKEGRGSGNFSCMVIASSEGSLENSAGSPPEEARPSCWNDKRASGAAFKQLASLCLCRYATWQWAMISKLCQTRYIEDGYQATVCSREQVILQRLSDKNLADASRERRGQPHPSDWIRWHLIALAVFEMDCVPEQKCTHWHLEGTRLWPKQSKTEWHPCSRLSTRVGSPSCHLYATCCITTKRSNAIEDP